MFGQDSVARSDFDEVLVGYEQRMAVGLDEARAALEAQQHGLNSVLARPVLPRPRAQRPCISPLVRKCADRRRIGEWLKSGPGLRVGARWKDSRLIGIHAAD